ncbi:MAG TPA: right-handed parallel beta-helix repeat-containing protein [Candidatus Paceibacterota bacterium]|nr:right-handed parallel beta-helix repeat-containing protein [Verrucomicrobiota bacterium]HRY50441.1 right-handed parallel beta-helix repeat-containing protein [Candidatus Paceibacterota bacterium]HSA02660.1 right-handed parallel beta-helix repeat-containing protein [Candidatus Paceibacterota bacterium]
MSSSNTRSVLRLLAGLVFLACACANSPGANSEPPSCSPALEEAAVALANSQLDVAARRFDEISKDSHSPAFIRGLAGIGIAETALARRDISAAIRAWRQLAENPVVPGWLRDLAQRRALETERGSKGLPERDPALYRVTLPVLPDPAVVFHVSPDGSDAADGSRNRPFKSLAKARDAIRDLKKSKAGLLPIGGVRVIIGAGSFVLKQPLRFTGEDSGTIEAPIVYAAEPGASVVLGGGLLLQGWKPITDPSVRGKLDASIRDQVLEVDLKANGVSEWGDATALKKRPELFVDGTPQILARWPNKGFVKTGDILGSETFKVWGSISGCKDGKFRFEEDRPKQWLDEPDVRLYGYWFWDWYEEYQSVRSIDPQAGSFTLAQPYASYGYRKGQRYYAANVFRELDQPEEWYLDRRHGKIYWLPDKTTEVSKAQTVLSVYSEPFVILENVNHLVLLGLVFQEGRGDGLHIGGGTNCLVAGCVFRRLGGDAVIVQGGENHGVFGCSMHTLGCGGMRIDGGDRRLLRAGRHFVENCAVSDISRIKRTYAPAVHLDGCGNRIAHNLFERIPSSAMRIEGNDHLIELNHVRHVVQESDDQGGIDMFGNPLYRGVVIRWNRWSDIKGGTECGAAGIRLDDMISGIVVHGNLFERCGAVQFGGVQIHGGKENVVDGNLFVDCHAGMSYSRWDEARWMKSIEPFLAQAGQEPFASRYPDLARLKSEPNVNFITRNILFGCKNVFLRDGGVEKTALMMISREPAPADLLSAGMARDRKLRHALFEPIPVSEIGPYTHPWCEGAPSQN